MSETKKDFFGPLRSPGTLTSLKTPQTNVQQYLPAFWLDAGGLFTCGDFVTQSWVLLKMDEVFAFALALSVDLRCFYAGTVFIADGNNSLWSESTQTFKYIPVFRFAFKQQDCMYRKKVRVSQGYVTVATRRQGEKSREWCADKRMMFVLGTINRLCRSPLFGTHWCCLR